MASAASSPWLHARSRPVIDVTTTPASQWDYPVSCPALSLPSGQTSRGAPRSKDPASRLLPHASPADRRRNRDKLSEARAVGAGPTDLHGVSRSRAGTARMMGFGTRISDAPTSLPRKPSALAAIQHKCCIIGSSDQPRVQAVAQETRLHIRDNPQRRRAYRRPPRYAGRGPADAWLREGTRRRFGARD